MQETTPAGANGKRNLALVGPMGAGKTSLAEQLVREHGFRRVSLADPLKRAAERFLGRPLDKGNDRALLQRLGDAGRSPFWREHMEHEQTKRRDPDALVMVAYMLAENITNGWRLGDYHPASGPVVGDRMALNQLRRQQATLRLLEALFEEDHFTKEPPLSTAFGARGFWVARLIERLGYAGVLAFAPDEAVGILASATHVGRPVVVDDVRMPAEVEALEAAGFLVVKVIADDELRRERVRRRYGERGLEGFDHHPSEVEAANHYRGRCVSGMTDLPGNAAILSEMAEIATIATEAP